MAASSLHILYKAPLEKTGYIGKPYFSLLVVYASWILICPSTVGQRCLWLSTTRCAASVCFNEALYCMIGALTALGPGMGGGGRTGVIFAGITSSSLSWHKFPRNYLRLYQRFHYRS